MQPPASLKALADPIYEAFYGLEDQPFAITTDPKFFFLSTSHERAYAELVNGLRRREGLFLLTGETGSGKTTLCRAVLESLGPRTFSAMILNPYMSGAEVFRIVLRDFGLVTHEDLRQGALASADIPQLVDTLEGFLRSLVPLETHAVIVLDEAQSLNPQVLDQLRLLTALEHANRRLVQIILCGQPGLLNTLKTEPLRALNERITRRVALAPLPPTQMQDYIDHRLAVAGGARAVSFDPGATKVVAELSHGLPRRVNVLCDRALQEGRIEGAAVITAELVKRGAKSLAGVHDSSPVAPSEPVRGSEVFAAHQEPPARGAWIRRAAAGLALAVALGAGALYLVDARRTLTAGLDLPAAPDIPAGMVPAAAASVPIPTDEELARILYDLPWRATSVQVPEQGNQFD